MLYLVASVLSYYPHFIPYFNELVWDRSKAYRILADSNLGWSQNHWYLRRYLRRHPEALFEPPGLQAGTIVLSVNKYVGLFVRRAVSLAAGELRARRPRGPRAPDLPRHPGGARAG